MSNITEKLDSLIENFVGEQSTNEEFERAQEFANQVFILAMDAQRDTISVLKAQLAQYQSDDYVLVPKDQIEIFWQDDDEPENFCSLESDLDCLGESYDVGDIMVINKTSSAHIKTEKLYGVSMPCKAVSILSRKSKLVLFDNYDDAHKAMIEAQEQHNAKP